MHASNFVVIMAYAINVAQCVVNLLDDLLHVPFVSSDGYYVENIAYQ